MNARTLCLLVPLLACADDDSFVSLPNFCGEFAAVLCEGRARCCKIDPAVCESAETASCTAMLTQYESERLDYDAVLAAKKLDTARKVAHACQSPPAIASYFEGGLPTASACERATQCASGSCGGEPRMCVEPVLAQLCPP